MTAWLQRQGYTVKYKRIRRIIRMMGLVAIYPKPRLSQTGNAHEWFPYVLRDVVIDLPNHVWCTDITSIRMVRGFVYLVVMMGW
jgi:putative transposase